MQDGLELGWTTVGTRGRMGLAGTGCPAASEEEPGARPGAPPTHPLSLSPPSVFPEQKWELGGAGPVSRTVAGLAPGGENE